MPSIPRASHTVNVDGQTLDRKLLAAFQKSAVGGSVSKKQVETEIAKHIRDAGKLTDVEIATIDHAARSMKLTAGAKATLGEIGMELRGKPVFAWQRGAASVDVRANPALPLSGKALVKAATDFILRGVEPVMGASADKPLPHLDSGNQNAHPSIITGDKAAKAVALFRALAGDKPHELLTGYDPQKHAVILTVGTEDETHIFLSILDKTTGKGAHMGDENTVDIGYMVDEAAFNAIFGDYKQFTSDPADPDAEYDYLDGYMLAEFLQDGGKPLPVFHGDDEGGPEHAAYAELSERAAQVADALGGQSWSRPVSVDMQRLPVVEDLPQMAKLMFIAGREEDSGIHYEHDGVPITVGAKERPTPAVIDDIAKAFIASYPHGHGAGALPDVAKKVKATLAALGDSKDVALFQVSATVKDETDHARTTEARSWAFVNEKTGLYAAFYARPDLPAGT